METRAHPPGLQDILQFPLVEALYGRRARVLSGRIHTRWPACVHLPS